MSYDGFGSFDGFGGGSTVSPMQTDPRGEIERLKKASAHLSLSNPLWQFGINDHLLVGGVSSSSSSAPGERAEDAGGLEGGGDGEAGGDGGVESRVEVNMEFPRATGRKVMRPKASPEDGEEGAGDGDGDKEGSSGNENDEPQEEEVECGVNDFHLDFEACCRANGIVPHPGFFRKDRAYIDAPGSGPTAKLPSGVPMPYLSVQGMLVDRANLAVMR